MIDAVYKDLISNILDRGYRYEDPNRKDVVRTEIPSYTLRHNFSDGFPAISLKKLAWKSVVTELIWFLKGDTNIKYLVDNGCNIWNKDYVNYYKKIRTKQCYCGHTTTCDCGNPGFSELENNIKNQVVDKKTNHVYGDLGKVYGHYWRNFNGVDQIKELIHDMINKPMSSELIVSARDPSDKDNQALPCCHYGFQIVMKPLTTYRMYILDLAKDKFGEHNKVSEIHTYGFELHWKQRSVDAFLG